MGTLMEGGNKTHNMVRSGVTVQLMAPLVGLGSSPNVSTNSQVAIGYVNGGLTMRNQMLAYHITGSIPVLTTN